MVKRDGDDAMVEAAERAGLDCSISYRVRD
jgi:hypothetical protein